MTSEAKPTEEDYALAREVAAWLETLNTTEQPNDYMRNLATLGRAGVVHLKAIRIAASALQAHNRDLARRRERAAVLSSEHVGVVGERLTLRVKLLSVWQRDSDFGVSHIHKFVTVDTGAVLTWFGSHELRTGTDPETGCYTHLKPGEEVWVKASVSKHDVYQGVKQTIVKRVALTTEPKAKKTRTKRVIKEQT